MSELVKCATCKTEKPFSEMQTCMHADREHSVCDMTCMIKFYKGEIKPDIVITPDLEEMGKLGMNPKEYDLYKANLVLAKQLAKANERVKELESQHQLFTKRIEPLLHMQEDGEYYERCHLAEEIYDDFVDSSPEVALNKFAIEKKIEALSSLLKHETSTFRLHNGNKRSGVFSIDIKHEIDALALRKEQE